jgi:hypothetical protein
MIGKLPTIGVSPVVMGHLAPKREPAQEVKVEGKSVTEPVLDTSRPQGIRCFRCSGVIYVAEVPGALLFSPPDDKGTCTKIHLCATCYVSTLEFCRVPTPLVLEQRFAALMQWLDVKAFDDTTAEQCAQWKAAAEHLGHAAKCMSVLDAIEKGDPNG